MLVLAVCAGIVPAIASGRGSGEPVSVIGTLEIGHFDDLRTGRAKHFSQLRTTAGQIPLTFRRRTPAALSGQRVAVSGVEVGGRLQVRSLRVLASTGRG